MTRFTAQVVQGCSSSNAAPHTLCVECDSCVWVWGNAATPMSQSPLMWGSKALFSQPFPTHSLPLSNSSDIRRWSFNEIITFALLTTSPSRQHARLHGNHTWSYIYHTRDSFISFISAFFFFFFSKRGVPGQYCGQELYINHSSRPLRGVGPPLGGVMSFKQHLIVVWQFWPWRQPGAPPTA